MLSDLAYTLFAVALISTYNLDIIYKLLLLMIILLQSYRHIRGSHRVRVEYSATHSCWHYSDSYIQKHLVEQIQLNTIGSTLLALNVRLKNTMGVHLMITTDRHSDSHIKRLRRLIICPDLEPMRMTYSTAS